MEVWMYGGVDVWRRTGMYEQEVWRHGDLQACRRVRMEACKRVAWSYEGRYSRQEVNSRQEQVDMVYTTYIYVYNV